MFIFQVEKAATWCCPAYKSIACISFFNCNALGAHGEKRFLAIQDTDLYFSPISCITWVFFLMWNSVLGSIKEASFPPFLMGPINRPRKIVLSYHFNH